MNHLDNKYVTFQFHPEDASFEIRWTSPQNVSLNGSKLGIHYLLGGQHFILSGAAYPPLDLQENRKSTSVHGFLTEQLNRFRPDQNGVQLMFTFAVPDELPFFFWKVCLINKGSKDIHVRSIDLLKVTGENGEDRSEICFGQPGKHCASLFFSNGWQSWSYTGTYGADQRQKGSILGIIPNASAWNPGTSHPRSAGEFRSEFFGVVVDRKSRNALLLGSLSQREQLTVLEAHLRNNASLRLWADCDDVRLPAGEKLETDWAVLSSFSMDQPDPLETYLEGVARENGAAATKEIPVGWCSWYQYYTKVTASDIENNLRLLSSKRTQLPLDLLQIDDGSQATGGDWLSFNERFPQGVAPLAQEIRKENLIPGLWLAPFIASRGARLLSQHPELILRNTRGKPVLAGVISDRLAVALDLTHPGAREYCANVIRKAVGDWGFPYLKLDFLYAAALRGRHYVDTFTRAQVLRQGLQALRDAAGEQAFLVGCGVPLGSAVGIFDSVRIGADTAPTWHPELFNIPVLFKKETSLPSARNAIQNILTRASMHNRWWINDPDCLLLRENTRLTEAEIETHATLIALTGGSLLLSDDLRQVPDERLRIVQVLLPLIGKRAEVLDLFEQGTPHLLRLDLEGAVGSWSLCAYFNWSDRPREFDLTRRDFRMPEQPLWVSSFWQETVIKSAPGQHLFSGRISPHGVILLAVKPIQTDVPQYVGSTLHISQGLEVHSWQAGRPELNFRIGPGYAKRGSISLQIPGDIQEATLDRKALSWQSIGESLYQFPLSIGGNGEIHISWN